MKMKKQNKNDVETSRKPDFETESIRAWHGKGVEEPLNDDEIVLYQHGKQALIMGGFQKVTKEDTGELVFAFAFDSNTKPTECVLYIPERINEKHMGMVEEFVVTIEEANPEIKVIDAYEFIKPILNEMPTLKRIDELKSKNKKNELN
jgi:hypothetical protein